MQCESCGAAHDHEKLLRFKELPHYLPLVGAPHRRAEARRGEAGRHSLGAARAPPRPPWQVLKRFAMNWSTGARVKLSDWLAVPERLDLAALLEPTAAAAGPGGAYGGHYFAYLRDEASGCWLKFNDATVTALSEAEAAAAFEQAEPPSEPKAAAAAPGPELDPESEAKAEPEAGAGAEHESSAASAIQAAIRRKRRAAAGAAPPTVGRHAYMLVYTRDGPAPGAADGRADPPPDLVTAVASDNERFALEKAKFEEEQRWLKFTVEPPAGGDVSVYRILRTDTLVDLLAAVLASSLGGGAAPVRAVRGPKWTIVGLYVVNRFSTAFFAGKCKWIHSSGSRPTQEDARLRVVHKESGLLLGAPGDPGTALDSLSKPRQPLPRLRLECKPAGTAFAEVPAGGTPIRLAALAADGDSTAEAAVVVVPKPGTIGGLRRCAAAQLSWDSDVACPLVVREKGGHRALPPEDDWLTLASQNILLGATVYSEAPPPPGGAPRLLAYFERSTNAAEVGYRTLGQPEAPLAERGRWAARLEAAGTAAVALDAEVILTPPCIFHQ